MDVDQIKRDRETWLQALETTTEKQGQHCLGDAEHGFCCLGLGCVALGLSYVPYHGNSADFAARVGLREETGKAKNGRVATLTAANDTLELSFKEIAAHIRANMDEYFLEETL